MKLRKLFGTSLSSAVGEEDKQPVLPSPCADQERPKRHYVYGHFDRSGVPFYIGKGTGRRAWSKERHDIWHRYVEQHLDGVFDVVILADDLDSAEAEELENEWVAQESATLVNWVNFGRKTDYDTMQRFHELRNENRKRIAGAKAMEATDLDGAVATYFESLRAIESYAFLDTEGGLVGQLRREEREENGVRGELEILDRLTLCLCKLGRRSEARAVSEEYFSKFRADCKLKAAEKIRKRVGLLRDAV